MNQYQYVVLCKFVNTSDLAIPVLAKTQSEVILHFLNIRNQPLSEAIYFNIYKHEKLNLSLIKELTDKWKNRKIVAK